MESRSKFLGHPIHQMLIPFPFGLLATAVIFDIIHLFSSGPMAVTLATVSFYMILAGIVGGLIAAPFGAIDWLAIPEGTRAKTVGLLHGIGNVVVLILFAISAFLRYRGYAADFNYNPAGFALVCSFLGFILAGITGWLGGELVDRLRVGVDDDAHVDAPSSLSSRRSRGSRPAVD